MKRFFKVWMIIAVTAVIAIGLAGCEEDDGGGFNWPAELKNTVWSGGPGFTFQEDESGTDLRISGSRYKVSSGSGDGTEGRFTFESGDNWTYTVSGTGDGRTMVLTQEREDGDEVYNLTYFGVWPPVN